MSVYNTNKIVKQFFENNENVMIHHIEVLFK